MELMQGKTNRPLKQYRNPEIDSFIGGYFLCDRGDAANQRGKQRLFNK